ncbi:MAG: type II toxin-antitoxin system prevent-host-death family antitoxin [Caldilineaceae bacterium]
MHEVGVRELKNEATEILREVREHGIEYIVTYHGKPVALLVPFTEERANLRPKRSAPSLAELEALWAEWDALAEEIDENWQSELSAVEQLSRDRR